MSKRYVLSLEDLLRGYRDEGREDSSGSFTLDQEGVRRRLSRFQLPGKYHWVLKIVQSLHAAGAGRIRLTSNLTAVHIESDVVPGEFETVDCILMELLSRKDSSQRALFHLAAGLQGSLAVTPRRLEMVTIHHGEERRFVLETGGWRQTVSAPQGRQRDYFRLTLERSLGEVFSSGLDSLSVSFVDRLFRPRETFRREQRVVDEKSRYAACEIILNGRILTPERFGSPRYHPEHRADSRKVLPHHHLVEVVVPAEEPGGLCLAPVGHASMTNRDKPSVRTEVEKFGVSHAYAIRRDLASRGRITFWEDGILLSRHTFESDCPGLVALIDARDLKKDLTTLQVVEDQHFEEVLEEVRNVGRSLYEILMKNIDRMPRADRLKAHLLTLAESSDRTAEQGRLGSE